MTAPYQGIVSQLRTAFPAPVSDRMHDAYFVFSFLRALDKVDALKSAAPMLGSPVELDYDAARRVRVPDDPSTLEAVTEDLVHYLSGMFIWGHPRAQINVCLAHHPQHHRRAAAVHLQPEPGERGILAPGAAGESRHWR
jgi:hypothetical protein